MTPDLFEPETKPGPVGPRANVEVGTCSWTDPSLIRSRRFYPRGCSSAEARLRHYASVFPVVEVDSSYFALPTPQNAQLWVERTPRDFRFNVKAFRLLTGHQTPATAFPPELQPLLPAGRNVYYADCPQPLRDAVWTRFIDALVPLRAAGKLTAVHFQFAPWMAADAESERHVQDCVERMRGHALAVEFRNETWFGSDRRAERTLAWERDLGVHHVVVDEPQGVGNFAHSVWAATRPELAIVRLHGRNAATWNRKGLAASSDRFNYDYADAELAELAHRTVRLAEQAFRVQVLVNVNFEDQGVRAARRIERMIRDTPATSA